MRKPLGLTTDITARLLSEKLGAELGTTVVVENRAGAAGIIGTQALLQSAPDGYTIGFGNIGPNGINYSLYKKLPYKHTDFSPITLVISVPNVLVVNSKSPYKTVKDLVDAIKKDPKGNYSFASSGTGQSPHMSAEMFSQRTGLTLTHIPFKGMGPAVAARLGGQVTFAIDNLPSSIEFIRSGQFRALAVTGAERSAQLPDVPTMTEFNPELDPNGVIGNSWHTFFAPAGTPDDIINKLNTEIVKIVKTPEIQARLRSLGLTPTGTPAASVNSGMAADYAYWGKLINELGIKLE